MDATKRVPTELEARMLLRDVARRMEDERAIGEYLVRSPGKGLLALSLGIFAGIGVGIFLAGYYFFTP